MSHSVRGSRLANRVPWYRDIKVLSLIAQIMFLLVLAGLALLLVLNVRTGLERQGLNTSFGFLDARAGFDIAEGTERLGYTNDSTYLHAFAVGLYNTLRVAVVGILLATIIGVVVGVARLSTNWLINRLALIYVEIIRNTPLLVQLVFWYFAVILQLPEVRNAFTPINGVFLSQRGLSLPWPVPTEHWPKIWPWMIAAVVCGLFVWFGGVFARARLRARDRVLSLLWPGVLFGVLLPLVVGFFAADRPLEWSVPRLGPFGTVGGATLTPEFAALGTALVVYTAAFIAEIVRSGIQSVPRGQIEAARSLGLSAATTLRLIVLPQALRVILPPLGNQYLNLTKNSSLAVAIGFPDLFSVANTAGNQSGNNLQALLLVLGVYLVLSLLIALVINTINRATRLRTR